MVTTDASSTIISWATAMMASARNRRGSGPATVISGASNRSSKVSLIAAP